MPAAAPPRDPQTDRTRLETLVQTLQAGRYDDGLRLAEAALADGLIHPLPLRLTASALQQAGRFEEAIARFQHAVDLAPQDPGGWAALSACLFMARRPTAALAASQAALDLAPNEPALLCGRAQLLQSLGRVDEAQGLYERALEIDPQLFEAALGLAGLAIEAGDWVEADRLTRGLIQRHGPAPNLTWLSARIAHGLGDHETARTEVAALLESERLQPAQRAEALLLRGQILDALNRPSEAFGAAVEGKAIQHRLFAERARGHEAETEKLRRLARWFQNADPAPWASAPTDLGRDIAGHVFLIGFPRSGATLLAQALAGHDQVVVLEEAPTLAAPYAEFMTTGEDLSRLAQISKADAALWRARYWAEVRAHGVEPAGRVFVDTAPAGSLHLPLIAKLFPRAKILFAVRDPRDVVLSCLRQNFQLNAMTYAFTSLAETAACYAACMDLVEIYRARLPLGLMEIRHEALVADLDGVSPAISAFLGLDPARARLAPRAPKPANGSHNKGQGRWRAYRRDLAPIMADLAAWVARFGYPET